LSAIDPATGKGLNDRQLRAEISTFMGAGFETTSHAITWNLTMLVSPEASPDRRLAVCMNSMRHTPFFCDVVMSIFEAYN
jgi:cytochrome P450